MPLPLLAPALGLGASILGRIALPALLRSGASRFLPQILRGLGSKALPEGLQSVAGPNIAALFGETVGFPLGSALGHAISGEPREGGFLGNLVPDLAVGLGGTLGAGAGLGAVTALKLPAILKGVGAIGGGIGAGLGTDVISRDVLMLGPDMDQSPRPKEDSNDDALDLIAQRISVLDPDEDDIGELKDFVAEAQLSLRRSAI